jgi:hypothetical protein
MPDGVGRLGGPSFDARLGAGEDHGDTPVLPPHVIRRSAIVVTHAGDDTDAANVVEVCSFEDEPVAHVRDHDGLPLSRHSVLKSPERPSDTASRSCKSMPVLTTVGLAAHWPHPLSLDRCDSSLEVSGGRHGKHRLAGLRAVRAIGPGYDPVFDGQINGGTRHGKRWSAATPPPSDAVRQTL